MSWLSTVTEPDVVHVHPETDAITHELDEDCVCGPTVEIVVKSDRPDVHVWTHFALGGTS